MRKYFGRDGRPCQKVEWMRLREDKGYRIVREYDNGEVYVRLEWLGWQDDPDTMFPDCWTLFLLMVGNYNAEGVVVPDPVENLKTFPSEGTAIQAYEAFLDRWTASHKTEDGEFVEEDNDLTPPPPPNPDAPSTSAAAVSSVILGEDDVGVW